MTSTITHAADREKRLVALSSVFAALFLTGIKVVVGLLTNSLGILSEAAHSGLDLGAAILTLAAVRVSARPPDREHLYGHGKAENLSALLQTLLLLATCAWIVREALDRLFWHPSEVEVTIWSFLVVGISIVIDVWRSRALLRVAHKHGSQALEADALHFSTDIWSSAVVMLGLVGVLLARWLPTQGIQAGWLVHADAVAALGVSGLVVFVTLGLGRRAIDALLDTAPRGLAAQIEEVARGVPGVAGVSQVRVRGSRPGTFADMNVAVARNTSFEEAHGVASRIEAALAEQLPGVDIMVHVDPVATGEDSLVEEIQSVAARHGLAVHAIRAHDVGGRICAAMHVEVHEEMKLCDAHERVTAFEEALRRARPALEEIVTHIEPRGDREAHRLSQNAQATEVHAAIAELPRLVAGVEECHQVSVHRTGQELYVSFHCLMDPDLPITAAHELTEQVERLLRTRVPSLSRIVVHMEPAGQAGV